MPQPGYTTTEPSENAPTQAQLLALTSLVAIPGSRARYLTAANTATKLDSLANAAKSGRAFFVQVNQWTLALDADTPELTQATQLLAQDLQAGGHEPVIINSGQPGHTHLFCVMPDQQSHDAWAAQATQAGIDQRTTIRPPLTPHRLNHLSPSLANDQTLHSAIDALQPPKDLAQFQRRLQRLEHKGGPLSPAMAHLLREGERSERTYTSRSEVSQALLTGMVNSGWDFTRAQRALSVPLNLGGHRYRASHHQDPDRANRQLERDWNKALAFVAANPIINTANKAKSALDDLANTIAELPWPGRTGRTDRAVLLTYLKMARRTGNAHNFAASQAELAVEAGIGRNTAMRATDRLKAAGWITKLHTGNGLHANRWKIALTPPNTFFVERTSRNGATFSHPLEIDVAPQREVQQDQKKTRTAKPETSSETRDPGLDVYRHSALGKGTASVLEALANTTRALTVNELAEETGLSPGGLWRILKRLTSDEDYELLKTAKVGRANTYKLATELTPEILGHIAGLFGTAGRRDEERANLEDARYQRRRRYEIRSVPDTETTPTKTPAQSTQTELFDTDPHAKTCQNCHTPIQTGKRADTQYCDNKCRAEHHRIKLLTPGKQNLL